MNHRETQTKVEQLAEPLLTSLGYCLVDCEFVNELGGLVLRLSIEKAEGGLSVEDCRKASRSVEALLDVEDPVAGRYTLEVSSPGLNRPLRKEADFVRFAGKNIRLRTKEPIDGRSNYQGLLKGFEAGNILMNIDGTDHSVPLDKLAKGNIMFTIEKKGKKILNRR